MSTNNSARPGYTVLLSILCRTIYFIWVGKQTFFYTTTIGIKILYYGAHKCRIIYGLLDHLFDV